MKKPWAEQIQGTDVFGLLKDNIGVHTYYFLRSVVVKWHTFLEV